MIAGFRSSINENLYSNLNRYLGMREAPINDKTLQIYMKVIYGWRFSHINGDILSNRHTLIKSINHYDSRKMSLFRRCPLNSRTRQI